MLYAIKEQKGAAMLTGECGSGKTLLSRILVEEFSNAQCQTAFIFDPRLPTLEFIKEIVNQLDDDTSSLSSRTEVFCYLKEILYRNDHNNRKTVIIIDDAQALLEESFKELRLLLNFQLNHKFLLTIILLGQPQLRGKINNLPEFKERIAIRYNLRALSRGDTQKYIQHRLKVAGSQEIFQDDTFNEIYKFSGGIPERINNICDMALLVGYGEGVDKIDKKTIGEVAKDLEGIHMKGDEKEENVCSHQAFGNILFDDKHFKRKIESNKQVSSKASAIRKQKEYSGIRYFD